MTEVGEIASGHDLHYQGVHALGQGVILCRVLIVQDEQQLDSRLEVRLELGKLGCQIRVNLGEPLDELQQVLFTDLFLGGDFLESLHHKGEKIGQGLSVGLPGCFPLELSVQPLHPTSFQSLDQALNHLDILCLLILASLKHLLRNIGKFADESEGFEEIVVVVCFQKIHQCSVLLGIPVVR